MGEMADWQILTYDVNKSTNSCGARGLATFDVNFHSLLIEVWSMVNSQIPLLTGQPSVDVELLQNNA